MQEKIPHRRKWKPTPVFLLGKPHRQRNLEDYSPWGCKSQTWLNIHVCRCSLLEFHVRSVAVMSNSLQPHGLQHARPPCPSPTPGACSNSYPLSWWCHPTIYSSIVPLSSCLQSFPALGSLPRSQFFTSGNQNIGASVSASVLRMNIQDWFSLGLTGFWSPCSPRDSQVSSNTTVQKYQFFSIQLYFFFIYFY